MPGLFIREFKCTLCRQAFTLLSGDLFLPEPDICDKCLGEIWTLEDEELVKYATERWPNEEKLPIDSLVQYIKQRRAQWPSAEEAIRHRKQMRKSFE